MSLDPICFLPKAVTWTKPVMRKHSTFMDTVEPHNQVGFGQGYDNNSFRPRQRVKHIMSLPMLPWETDMEPPCEKVVVGDTKDASPLVQVLLFLDPNAYIPSNTRFQPSQDVCFQYLMQMQVTHYTASTLTFDHWEFLQNHQLTTDFLRQHVSGTNCSPLQRAYYLKIISQHLKGTAKSLNAWLVQFVMETVILSPKSSWERVYAQQLLNFITPNCFNCEMYRGGLVRRALCSVDVEHWPQEIVSLIESTVGTKVSWEQFFEDSYEFGKFRNKYPNHRWSQLNLVFNPCD